MTTTIYYYRLRFQRVAYTDGQLVATQITRLLVTARRPYRIVKFRRVGSASPDTDRSRPSFPHPCPSTA